MANLSYRSRRSSPWTALCLPLGCVSALALAPAAFAQTATEPETSQVEEVVVTARQRAENLQEVPDSITFFSAQEIEGAQIQDFGDFTALTPNFEFFPSATPGNFQMSIRGISQAGGNGGDAPVVMVVDGVTLPYPNSFTMPLFDIQSIAVLKGPQGALYGQNAIGGAVVVTTQQPTNEFHGRLTGSYGKANENELIGVVSGPIIKDKLLFRASAYHHGFDGDIRYAYAPREKANYLDDNLVRLDLKFLPAPNFTADFSVDYGVTHSGTEPLVPVTLSRGSGIPNVSTEFLNNQLILNEPNADYHTRTRRSVINGSLRLLWETRFADFTSVTAGTHLRENNLQDLDVSYIPFVYLTDQPVYIRAFSQEFRATSPSDQRLRWNAAAFMSRVNREIPFSVFGNLNLLIPPGDTNPDNAVLIPFVFSDAVQQLDSYAVAAQINYDILPTLELTLAGRFDHDPRSQIDQGVKLERTFSQFQPKLSLSYKPTPDQTYYYTFAQGFRPGGFNPGNNPAVSPVFDPEKTTTHEIGAKLRFLDQRLRLTAAAYTTKYENQQLSLVQVSAGGATQSIFTVKENEINGLEIEAQAEPVEGLELGFGGGWQSGKIKEFGDSLIGEGFDPSSYIGNNVPLQSQYTYNISVQYSRLISGAHEGFARADLTGKGRLYWYADNRVSRPPFSLLNLRAGVRNETWEAALYGTNVLDERYQALYFDNTFVGAPGGFDFARFGEKSRYGVEVTYRF